MPKLNQTHLPNRLREAIEQLERGEEVEAKKNKTLLNAEQQQALEDAWNEQQALRKKYKAPKTEEEKKKIGWKDKREVRIEIYKQAYKELMDNIFDIHLNQLEREQARATKAYMDGYLNAKEGQDRHSAGKIAAQRAGFMVANTRYMSKRDLEVRKMEEELLKRFEAEMTDEEREQRELLKETERAEERMRKSRFK